MIDQPQSNIELPADLARAIEQSRNMVTVNEAEALRLEELARSSRYTVNELHKEQVELIGRIDDLRRLRNTLDQEVNTNRQTLFDIARAVQISLKDKEDAVKETAKAKEAMQAERALLDKKNGELDLRAEELADKGNTLHVRSLELEEKSIRIKDFASGL